MDPDQLIALIEHRAWVPLAAVVIGFLVRLVKSDVKIPINIRADRRIWLVIALGAASGVLEHVMQGKTWTSALLGGVVSTGIAVLFHETAIASLRGGKELPVPGLMIPGMPPAPTAPPTVPLETDFKERS